MLTSMICAPFADLLARHVERRRIVARRDQLAELGRAGDVGALADIDEAGCRSSSVKGSRPESRSSGSICGIARGATPSHGLGDRANVIGRRAAAAADDVDEPGSRELADERGHVFRALVIVGRIHWAGRRWDRRRHACRRRATISSICGRISLAPSAQLKPIENGRAWRSECQKASRRLARQRAAGEIGDRARDHDRQARPTSSNASSMRHDGGLGVQRVEDRFDQQHVRAAFDQAERRLLV